MNFLHRPRRHIDIEIAVKGNLIANLGLVLINPSVRDIGQDFPFHVGIYLFIKRYVLVVPEFRIGDRPPFGINDNIRCLVPFGEGVQYGFIERSLKFKITYRVVQQFLEFSLVLDYFRLSQSP